MQEQCTCPSFQVSGCSQQAPEAICMHSKVNCGAKIEPALKHLHNVGITFLN